jgi:hypothetical protein
MIERRALLALTGLAVLVLPAAVSAGKQQAVAISAGGATELGKTTVEGNPSLRDFKATMNVTDASALLTWMQQLHRRQTLEQGPIVIRLENGQKFEFLEPMITNVDLSGARTVTLAIKHREGKLTLTIPKDAWKGSWPPPKK